MKNSVYRTNAFFFPPTMTLKIREGLWVQWVGCKGVWLNSNCMIVSVRCIAISCNMFFVFHFFFFCKKSDQKLQAQNTSLAKFIIQTGCARSHKWLWWRCAGCVQVQKREEGEGDERWRVWKDIIADWILHYVLSSDGSKILHMRSMKLLKLWSYTIDKWKKQNKKQGYISQTLRNIEIKQRKRKKPTRTCKPDNASP